MSRPRPFRHEPGTVLGYRRDGRPILPIAGASDDVDDQDDDDDDDHDDDNPAAEALGTLSELIRTAVREELTSWDAARQPPKSARKRKPAPKPEPEPAKPPTILDQLGSLFRP